MRRSITELIVDLPTNPNTALLLVGVAFLLNGTEDFLAGKTSGIFGTIAGILSVSAAAYRIVMPNRAARFLIGFALLLMVVYLILKMASLVGAISI